MEPINIYDIYSASHAELFQTMIACDKELRRREIVEQDKKEERNKNAYKITFKKDFLEDINPYQMSCPICGCECTHLKEIKQYEYDDRLCVELIFYCEEGDLFSLDFYQSTGITYPLVKHLGEYHYKAEEQLKELG